MRRIFATGPHGNGAVPMFWLRPLNTRRAIGAVVLSLVCFALACLLTACSGVVENTNGPVGPERVTWGTTWPRPLAPRDGATKHSTKRTTNDAGTVTDETSCDECEGGACRTPAPAK